MPIVNPLEEIRNELHVSYSQISTYLNCSLRYKFQYVGNRPQEQINIALPFGSAVHAAIALYYRSLKAHGRIEPAKSLCERFEDCLSLDLDNTDVPVIYKRDLPDRSAAVEMGKALLETFHENIDLENMEIVDVEVPLVGTLYDSSRRKTDFNLFGILDLILRDGNGELWIIDLKTFSKPMSQSTADDDLQMTAYSYLLAANRYVPATSEVKCRFDILRKLKNHRLEHCETTRTTFDRRRFASIAGIVNEAISYKIFVPRPSWKCNSCSYSKACSTWSS